MAIMRLSELYDVKSGIGTKKRTDFFIGAGTKIIMFKDVFYNHYLKLAKLKYEVKTTTNELSRFNVKFGDVFLTSSSETLNELAMSSIYLDMNETNVVYSGFLKRLRPKGSHLLPKYSQFLFRSNIFRNQINGKATMVTRANLNMSLLNSIIFNVPSIDEQQQIIDIIEPLEYLIRNIQNQILEINKTLALFSRKKSSPYKFKDFNIEIKTGKLNNDVVVANGKYRFFSCSNKIQFSNKNSFYGEYIILSGNGNFYVDYINSSFDLYQRVYSIKSNCLSSSKIYCSLLKNISTLKKGSSGSVIKFIKVSNIQNTNIIKLQKNEEIYIHNLLNLKQKLTQEKLRLKKLISNSINKLLV